MKLACCNVLRCHLIMTGRGSSNFAYLSTEIPMFTTPRVKWDIREEFITGDNVLL